MILITQNRCCTSHDCDHTPIRVSALWYRITETMLCKPGDPWPPSWTVCVTGINHEDKQSTNSLILDHTTTYSLPCDTYITELIDLQHLRYWSRRYVVHTYSDVNITQFMQQLLHDTDHTKQVLYIPWVWSHTNKGQCSMIPYHRNNAL